MFVDVSAPAPTPRLRRGPTCGHEASHLSTHTTSKIFSREK